MVSSSSLGRSSRVADEAMLDLERRRTLEREWQSVTDAMV